METNKTPVAICALSTLLSLVAFANEPASPSKDFWLERDAVVETAKMANLQSYPNANDIVLDEKVLVEYGPDGAAKTWDDEYVKILTEKGRRERQTLTLSFNSHYSSATPLLIEVIKPDGRIRKIDIDKQSRIMIERSQMGANIYNPSQKEMKITLPGLEVGDICHYKIMRNRFKARMKGTWSDYMVFEHTSPIMRISYQVKAPKELPLAKKMIKDAVKDTISYSETNAEDYTTHTWTVEDVPRMYKEPQMPPLHTVVQRLLVSTIPDWETVSKWYWNLSKPRLEATTQAMEDKVAELIADAGNDMEKVRAIFRFVSQEVRYMGITTEETAPGYEPHDVDITFKNRYGVCRDKAALLVAMLRIAGLKGYPVLIYVGPKKDKEVPQPYFNHAIAAVELEPGEYTLMDPTDESTRDLLPNYLCNKSYLVAKPNGETLKVSPIVPAKDNLLLVSSKARLGENNKLTVDTQLDFEGVNDSIYRGFFARKKPEDLRRFFEKRIRESIPGARLETFSQSPKDLMNTDRPLKVSLSFSANDYMVKGDATAMLLAPWVGKSLGVANFVLRGTGLKERKYPLATDIACGIDEEFRIDLTEADLEVDKLPSEVNLDMGGASYVQRYNGNANMLKAHSRLLLKSVKFPPQDYSKLKELLGKREVAKKRKPLYKTMGQFTENPDVKILSRTVDTEIKEEDTWTTQISEKKRILTYAGKKENSEIKIDYVPAWEEVKLDRAEVTSPDGTVHTVSKEEINIMDASWVGSAPRYPASKTLVASLPGVEAGSTIETRIIIHSKGKPFYSSRWLPLGFDPVKQSVFRLTTPVDMDLEIRQDQGTVSDAIQLVHAAESNETSETHTWEIESAPGLRQEENMPPSWTYAPSVFISNGNWQDYMRTLDTKLKAAARKQEKCGNIAREITNRTDARKEKIQAIRDYVVKNIRLAGPGLHNMPLSAITPADQTVEAGYGNSVDRAVVLYATLESAGLNPEIVLASSWSPRVAQVVNPLVDIPARDLFDAVLVRLKTENGFIYLNDSDQYAVLGSTKFAGRTGMTLDGSRFIIRPTPSKENRSAIEYTIDLESDGDAHLGYVAEFYGTSFTPFHRKFAEMPPEERKLHFEELVSSISQNAEAQSKLTTAYNEYPGRKFFEVEIDQYAIREANRIYLQLPRALTSPLKANTDTRYQPFYRSTPFQANVNYRINLPGNVKDVAILPSQQEWEGPSGFGRIDYTSEIDSLSKGKSVAIQHTYDLNPSILSASQYQELLNVQNELENPQSWMLMINLNSDR